MKNRIFSIFQLVLDSFHQGVVLPIPAFDWWNKNPASQSIPQQKSKKLHGLTLDFPEKKDKVSALNPRVSPQPKKQPP